MNAVDSRYIVTHDTDTLFIEQIDGISWADAPIPRRWHRCRPWLRALNRRSFHPVSRCACGAISLGGDWFDRNSRRKP